MSLPPLLRSQYALVILAASLGWCALYSVLVAEVLNHEMVHALAEGGLTSLVLIASLATTANVLSFYQPSNNRTIFLVTLATILTAAITFIDVQIHQLLASQFEVATQSRVVAFFHGGFALVTHLAVIGLSIQRNLLVRQTEMERQQQETERLKKEAELFKLRYQLQPHFLFNSLNSINALIRSRPEEARKMIQQLSDFLRGTIHQEEEKWVTLHDEVKHVGLYLDIEQVRFSHRLQVEVDVDDACRELRIPPLLIQPLLENAIKFGLYGTTDAVRIELKVRCTDHGMKVTVSNPFDPEYTAKRKGTGFGLASIRRRLQLIYGRNDLISTTESDKRYIVTLQIPQPS